LPNSFAGGVTAACLLLIGIASQADPLAFQSLTEAEAHYHAQLVEHPDHPLPRLELARTYFLQGRDTLAQEHFERVLASDPPPTVKTNIHRFLDRIRARRKWKAHIGFSIAPDSNIDRQTDADCILFQGLCFTPNQKPTSGTGLRAWGGAEYQHPLGEKLRLRMGIDIDRTEYEGSRFDRMTLTAQTGPRWLINPRSEVSLLGVVRQHWKADKPQYRDAGVQVEGRYRLDQRTVVSGRVSRLEREHKHNFRLNGPLVDFSLGIDRVLTATLRGRIAIGLSREKPVHLGNRNTGQSLTLGLSALLPKGYTVGGRIALAQTEWEGRNLLVPGRGKRKDKTRTVRLRVHRRDFTVMGFSPEISIQWEDRASSAQLVGYKRWSGGLSFVRPF